MVADASALHAHCACLRTLRWTLVAVRAVAPVRVCVDRPAALSPRYTKAAVQGHVGAQYNLGMSYKRGEVCRPVHVCAGTAPTPAPGLQGVERDLKTAVKWYHKAAEAGNSGAQFNLGNCYKRGEGYVPPLIAACPRAVAHELQPPPAGAGRRCSGVLISTAGVHYRTCFTSPAD